MSDHLPPEIIAEILLRLSLKPLLGFRLVSKQWLAQIDDPDFTRRHVHQSTVTNTNNLLFIQEDSGSLYNLNFDDLRPGKTLTFLENLHLPPIPQIGTSFVGTCDGLICTRNEQEDLMVFNPLTSECKEIFRSVPPSNRLRLVDHAAVRATAYGFGYDRVADDYKVVRIVETVDQDLITQKAEAWVFHVKKGTRTVVEMPYLVRRRQPMGELVNGSLHWLAAQIENSLRSTLIFLFDLGQSLIIVFDLGLDQFRVVPQPEHLHKYFAINIGVLGSCLSLFGQNQDGTVDVLVMKEYGVKESWTKLVTFALEYTSLRPLGYSYTGKEIMLEVLDENRLVWLDLMTKTVHNIEIRGLKVVKAFACLAGLVSPKPKPANMKTNEKKQQTVGQSKNLKKRDDFLSTGFKLKL